MPSVHRSFVSRPLQAALLALGLGAASLSFAQIPTHGMPGMHSGGGPGMHAPSAGDHQAMREKMSARQAQRLSELKQKLALSADQEAAWTTWTAALQPRGPMATTDRRAMRDEMAKLTTPERIDRMRAMRAQHHSAMDQRADATKAFYAVLTPEQRKVFDAQTARMMQPGMGMDGPHHPGMHRHHG